jgi:RNA polymerase sigma factor (TIGR02999 family)
MPNPKTPPEPDHDTVSNRELLDAVFQEHYGQIKRRLHLALRNESQKSLQTTDLMHEIYLKLLNEHKLPLEDLRAMLNLLSEKTRNYLIDRSRRRNAIKRGGGVILLSLTSAVNNPGGKEVSTDIISLNEALMKLEIESPLAHQVVNLTWFIGITQKEIALILGLTRSQVQSLWEFSKIWLSSELKALLPATTEENNSGQ